MTKNKLLNKAIWPETGLPATCEQALRIHLHGINNTARNAERGISEEGRGYIVTSSAMAIELLNRLTHYETEEHL